MEGASKMEKVRDRSLPRRRSKFHGFREATAGCRMPPATPLSYPVRRVSAAQRARLSAARRFRPSPRPCLRWACQAVGGVRTAAHCSRSRGVAGSRRLIVQHPIRVPPRVLPPGLFGARDRAAIATLRFWLGERGGGEAGRARAQRCDGRSRSVVASSEGAPRIPRAFQGSGEGVCALGLRFLHHGQELRLGQQRVFVVIVSEDLLHSAR